LVIAIIWLIKRKYKLENMRAFVLRRGVVSALGGLWAMLPDLEYFFEDLKFNDLSYVDIFFFHGTFDRTLPETDLFLAGELLLIFMIVNILAITLTVESFQILKTAIFGEKEEEEEDEEEGDVEKKEQDKPEDVHEEKDTDEKEEEKEKNKENNADVPSK
jgi:hypothetical protein